MHPNTQTNTDGGTPPPLLQETKHKFIVLDKENSVKKITFSEIMRLCPAVYLDDRPYCVELGDISFQNSISAFLYFVAAGEGDFAIFHHGQHDRITWGGGR